MRRLSIYELIGAGHVAPLSLVFRVYSTPVRSQNRDIDGVWSHRFNKTVCQNFHVGKTGNILEIDFFNKMNAILLIFAGVFIYIMRCKE